MGKVVRVLTLSLLLLFFIFGSNNQLLGAVPGGNEIASLAVSELSGNYGSVSAIEGRDDVVYSGILGIFKLISGEFMIGNAQNWSIMIDDLLKKDKVVQVSEPSRSRDVLVKGYDQNETKTMKNDVVIEKATSVNIKTTQYGTSGQGNPLNVVSIEPPNYSTKILAVFEVHGFEDAYSNDGWALVNIGNKLVEYFSANPEKLNGKSLYVVTSANPDGLISGWTNNGPGRCQVSGGVDINRDFDYYWSKRFNNRNRTLEPFSAPESRALRDLVINLRPNDVVDIHGWISTTYGTASLCSYFENSLGIGRSGGLTGASGYFSAWALGTGYCERSALIELPSPHTDPDKVIESFCNLFAN